MISLSSHEEYSSLVYLIIWIVWFYLPNYDLLISELRWELNRMRWFLMRNYPSIWPWCQQFSLQLLSTEEIFPGLLPVQSLAGCYFCIIQNKRYATEAPFASTELESPLIFLGQPDGVYVLGWTSQLDPLRKPVTGLPNRIQSFSFHTHKRAVLVKALKLLKLVQLFSATSSPQLLRGTCLWGGTAWLDTSKPSRLICSPEQIHMHFLNSLDYFCKLATRWFGLIDLGSRTTWSESWIIMVWIIKN